MAETLTSMKLDPKTRAEQAKPMDAGDAPLYPYGLQVRLGDESLEALGIKTLPKVGTTMVLVAHVDVVSTSSNATPDGQNQSLELQITDLALGPLKDAKDYAAALYGKDGEKAKA